MSVGIPDLILAFQTTLSITYSFIVNLLTFRHSTIFIFALSGRKKILSNAIHLKTVSIFNKLLWFFQ